MTKPTQPTSDLIASMAAPIAAEASYDQAHFEPLFAAEERHFWFRARNQVITTVVRQLTADYAPGYRFLEIGCGNGNVLRELETVCSGGTAIGMDLFIEGLRFARRRVSSPLLQADIYDPPFKTQFEMIGLFDVLEHLPDDGKILAHLRSMLTADGALLITVPAYMSLWSYADRLANHKRRYTQAELTHKLEANGFRVAYSSYYMMSILPLVWLRRKLADLWIGRASDPTAAEDQLFQDEFKVRPGLNQFLMATLRPEVQRIAARRPVPFGTSLLAVAYKAEKSR